VVIGTAGLGGTPVGEGATDGAGVGASPDGMGSAAGGAANVVVVAEILATTTELETTRLNGHRNAKNKTGPKTQKIFRW
jgi:hypothetical protein